MEKAAAASSSSNNAASLPQTSGPNTKNDSGYGKDIKGTRRRASFQQILLLLHFRYSQIHVETRLQSGVHRNLLGCMYGVDYCIWFRGVSSQILRNPI